MIYNRSRKTELRPGPGLPAARRYHHSSEQMYPRGGAIGGSYTWKFVPTSIGTFGSVQCSCGEEFSFQEEW